VVCLHNLVALASRIRPRLLLDPVAVGDLSQFLGHTCAKAGKPLPFTQDLVAFPWQCDCDSASPPRNNFY